MPIEYRIFAAGHCSHAEYVTIQGGSRKPVSFPALCFLLQHPEKGPILFDTGFSHAFTQLCARFPEKFYNLLIPVSIAPEDDIAVQIERAGFGRGDIRTIILSHFHIDHMGGLADFPQAEIYCSREGYESIKDINKITAMLRGYLPALLPSDFERRARYFEDTEHVALPQLSPFHGGYDIFGDGSIFAVSLPGHAQGQYGLFFEDAHGTPTLLAADACWSSAAYRDFKMPHTMTRLVHHDWTAYKDTLSRLHALYKNAPDMRIIPSHCREVEHE